MDEIDKKEILMEKAKNSKMEIRYKTGFWFMIIFLMGFIASLTFTQWIIIEPRLKEATKLGAMVIDNRVYDLKERF